MQDGKVYLRRFSCSAPVPLPLHRTSLIVDQAVQSESRKEENNVSLSTGTVRAPDGDRFERLHLDVVSSNSIDAISNSDTIIISNGWEHAITYCYIVCWHRASGGRQVLLGPGGPQLYGSLRLPGSQCNHS